MVNSTGHQNGLLFDRDRRLLKATKIWRVLRDVIPKPPSQLRLLDVGCSAGIIAKSLKQYFGEVIGVDIDPVGLSYSRDERSQVVILCADTCVLPFCDNVIDVAICTQVYEHVANQKALVSELYRVLKPGAIVYFSGPNRLSIIEDHYGLPFLSWLPRSLASVYLRAANRGTYYEETPLGLRQLRHLWRRFEISDITINLIKEPYLYEIENELGRLIWLKHCPIQLLRVANVFFPNYNWILRKPFNTI